MVSRKSVMYGTAIALSGAVMVTSGFSARASGEEGYQVWKSAMKATHQIESATVNGTMKVSDNSKPVLAVTFGAKGSISSEAVSGTVKVEQDGTAQGAAFYHKDGQSVVKFDGEETYYVNEADSSGKSGKHRMHHGSGSNPAMESHMEDLMDAIAGKYRSYVKLEESADQSKVVSLSLSDDEIPVLLNTAGALILEHALSAETEAGMDAADPHSVFHDKLNIKKPEIGTDVHIKQIDVQAVIGADQLIREQSMKIQATSKDAEGKEHTWTFDSGMGLTNVNQTIADTVNLEGKKTEALPIPEHGRH
ncbi:hypothetical protein [Gorillibacterium sp. sgz5001074]|uniref:hypothetical protein n=1 Tax=Gorillibacterium sp. sgz5001074 TaxID=3446695 RepID=UPI003F663A0D